MFKTAYLLNVQKCRQPAPESMFKNQYEALQLHLELTKLDNRNNISHLDAAHKCMLTPTPQIPLITV